MTSKNRLITIIIVVVVVILAAGAAVAFYYWGGQRAGTIVAGEGRIQIRAFVDLNYDQAYGPAQQKEGSFFSGKQAQVTVAGSSQVVCSGTINTSGLLECTSLDDGSYDVKLLGSYPYADLIVTEHNTTGKNPVRVTLSAGYRQLPVDFGFLQKGRIQVRGFVDINKDDTYGPAQQKEGSFLDGHKVKIVYKLTGQEINYAKAGCTNNVINAAGLKDCGNLPYGDYTVQLVDTLTNSTLTKTRYNQEVENPVSISLVEDWHQIPVDFGFDQQGRIEVRAFNDLNNDDAYGPAMLQEGGYFKGKRIKITYNFTGAEIDYDAFGCGDTASKKDNILNNAGLKDCKGLPYGKYIIELVDKVTGLKLKKTEYNASGENPITIALAENSHQIPVDFGHRSTTGVVSALGTCSVAKTVSDATAANEGTPDDPKATNSSEGEILSYKIAFDCPDVASVVAAGVEPRKVVIIDEYDIKLVSVNQSTISNSGVLDVDNGQISWTLLGAAGNSGELTFNAIVDDNLSTGTYKAVNKVTITSDNNPEAEDSTTTTIKATAGVTPATPSTTTTPVTPSTSTTTTTPTQSPQTGVGALALALLTSIAAAVSVLVYAIKRPKLKTARNRK